MSKTDRDDIIISALITAPTIRAAADSIEMSESQIYARLNERDFRQKYNKAKTAILKAAESNIITKISDSINGIWKIATNPYTPDKLKLRCYDLILSNAVKISEASHKAERDAISDDENDRHTEELSSLFDI